MAQLYDYTVTFKSLRIDATYVVTISGGSSGTIYALKPGTNPFTTDEDSDEDQFKPVRTQTGYVRVLDDGKDANGNALPTDWWKDLQPDTDISRPVVLKIGSTIVWQGFMQAQNFGGVIYGNPQEREFPVQCILSVLGTYKASTAESGMKNFAWLLHWLLVDNMPTAQQPTRFYIQGGEDARVWLQKRFDWMNFMREVEDNDIESAYSHYDILEDMCKFWGWTCRTHRQYVYLTCTDDAAEKAYMLTLTEAQLATLAGGTSAGTVSTSGMSTLSIPDAFASTNNDTYQNQGPSKATVKADVNKNEMVVQFAPASVRALMNSGWTWQTGDEDLVGYFYSNTIDSFDESDSKILAGNSVSGAGGFQRRQVYSSADQDKPSECDMFLFNHIDDGSWVVHIQTLKAMSFAGGSLKLGGTVYVDSKVFDKQVHVKLHMRLGIGMTRQTARWWYMNDSPVPSSAVVYGWGTAGSLKSFNANANSGQIKSTMFVSVTSLFPAVSVDCVYDRIPVPDEADMYGFLFIDFLGLEYYDEGYKNQQVFQIANFSIEFSRDTYSIPTDLNTVRQREIKAERESTREYTAENNSRTQSEWNVDCIFASDNNMEYGYGLLMEPNGRFMKTTQYGNSSSNLQHPEQHLANRVASYWQKSRRRVKAELQANATVGGSLLRDAITPGVLVSLDGMTGHPVAISHNWCDDVISFTALEMP